MNRLDIINLFDTYETLLTKRNREIFKYYYYEDLSLGEISTNLKISRTAIYNTLKKVEKKLKEYENTLNLYKTKQTLNQLLEEKDIQIIKKEIKKLL